MPDVVIDELLVFSDHHAHPFPYGAKEVLHGGVLTNSRLIAACDVLKQMESYAKTHSIKTVVFGGDLFHTRESVSTDAYNATLDALRPLVSGRRTFLLTGNHDYHDREGLVHSLHGLKFWGKDVQVVDWTSSHTFRLRGVRGDHYHLCFVPYTEDRAKAVQTLKTLGEYKADGPKVLFAHLGMQGAKVGSDYVLVNDGDVTVSDVPSDAFAGCLFGHYHQHQKLFRNGWYIGASHHHTWGDVNTQRGFLHVRVYVDSIDFEFVETNSPRFIAVREDELDTVDIRMQDFVKVFTSKRLSDEGSTAVRKKAKAENCEVVYVPPEIKLKDIELDEQQLAPAAMVETWVKANENWLQENMPDVPQEDLVNYGRTLLAKVQNV